MKILLEGGAKVNHKGYDGKSKRTVACSVLIEDADHPNLLSFVRLLLMHGADPNNRGMKRRICLMYALHRVLPLNVIDMLLTHNNIQLWRIMMEIMPCTSFNQLILQNTSNVLNDTRTSKPIVIWTCSSQEINKLKTKCHALTIMETSLHLSVRKIQIEIYK